MLSPASLTHSNIRGASLYSSSADTLATSVSDPRQSWTTRRTPFEDGLETVGFRFRQLDINSRELAAVLVFLGPVKIPSEVLTSALKGTLCWNEEGEVDRGPRLQLPVFENDHTLTEALCNLKQFDMIRETLTGEDSSVVDVNAHLQAYIQCDSMISEEGKIKAIRFVIYTFPKSRVTDPLQ